MIENPMLPETSARTADAGLTVGQRLRAARESRGLELRDVAATTRIQAAQLQFIEEGRFHELPAEVVVRGFLRSYARELRLDEGEILSRYHAETGRTPAPRAAVVPVASAPAPASRSVGAFAESSRLGRVAYAGGLVAMVVGLALAVLTMSGDSAAESAAANFPSSDGPDAWRPAPEAQSDWQTWREN